MPGQPVAVPGSALTAAVRLHHLDPELARALLDGERPAADPPWHPQFPLTDTLTGIRLLLDSSAGAPAGPATPWWMYLVETDGLVVGEIGFHGPPPAEPPRAVEIGYEVVPAWRRKGVATRACALLLELAWAAGADEVWAETDPDNTGSRAVLARNGFTPEPVGRLRVRRPS